MPQIVTPRSVIVATEDQWQVRAGPLFLTPKKILLGFLIHFLISGMEILEVFVGPRRSTKQKANVDYLKLGCGGAKIILLGVSLWSDHTVVLVLRSFLYYIRRKDGWVYPCI